MSGTNDQPPNDDRTASFLPAQGRQNEDEDTPSPGETAPAFPVAPSEASPHTIGRYRVIRELGKGGFGRVYLAHDDDLKRSVAIKVPNRERISSPEDVEAYLNEARILASLDHPNIVPVYDLGRSDDGLCYVVSKLIEGSDLATRIKDARPSVHESAGLVATIAEALHYAHTRGLVHRDIKPANILIDASGKAFVADFGLALKDEDFGSGARIAGTPAYMSPEQARGEGHLVDGRSDIFSLGVVFYELLTGRRPFVAKAEDKDQARNEYFDLIARAEARPPRQIDDTIPKELERICQKALSKRASERYSTGKDMAEDLRLWLQTVAGTASPVVTPGIVPPQPASTQELATPSPTSRQSDSDQRPIKIVPKGLRSFDEHDSDFFLELLPGPRDRDGLPDSIRFWKRKIEQIDPDKTFRVGLIYGPSGCGKSSLVKAGLLPRLAKHVVPVYIEATPDETEARLLKGLRKACPELPQALGLVDSLANLRRGRILPPERKVLLVLDQFEQWLHANRGEEGSELVTALRHCDGEHVQAIVMVRDDFWLSASRFMRDLEIRLLEGENSALVDLFDPRHAKKVLMAFGRAYGALPEKTGDLTSDQESFLDQSITELAEDGKIISVRLALFAEMVKGKPWTPATLKDVGGTEGIGLTFLEETFSASTAPPEHRFHQEAAQAVLKALLPETGSDIKGQMRSRQELLDASGYANRPREFDDLIHILDPELRLITPTEPEGTSSENPATTSSGRFYVLAHDYLVHSLRDWLTRKQRETRRGRAGLRLAERSASWNAKPENRQLPSALEWANIRLLTKKKDWTEPQRKMMQRAGRVHGLRTLGFVTLVSLITWGGIESYGTLRASALVESLQKVGTPDVPAIVRQLSGYRRWANPRLLSLLKSPDDRKHLHASLALLPVNDSQVDYLFDRLIKATPSELFVLRDALKPHQATLVPKLWSLLDSAEPGDVSFFPTASALADYDADSPRWESVGGRLTQALSRVNPVFLGVWLDALRPVRAPMTPQLAAVFKNVADLLLDADPKAFVAYLPIAQYHEQLTSPLLKAEIAKKLTLSWNDPPLDPSWITPDPSLTAKIESAQGMLSDRFAFCQTMTLDDFLTTAEALRHSGYRPTRFRPYSDGQVMRVAAVWTRDGRPWRMAHDQTDDEIRQTDERNQKEGHLPVEVAGYRALGGDEGKPTSRFAALWAQRVGPDDDARLVIAHSATELTNVTGQLKNTGMVPLTLHAWRQSDGQMSYSGVWKKGTTGTTDIGSFQAALVEVNIPGVVANHAGFLIDLDVNEALPPPNPKERSTTALQAAEAALKTNPGDPNARLSRATAYSELGENQKAIDDLDAVIGNPPTQNQAYQYRAIAHARLGHKEEALADLVAYQKGGSTKSFRLYLAVIVAAELGQGTDEAFNKLEAALKQRPQDSDLNYNAACTYALASQAVARKDQVKSQALAERAIALVKKAIENGYSDYKHMQEDSDLDPLRDLPAFAEIMKAGKQDCSYAAVWSSDSGVEASPLVGLDPTTHLQRCRELASQGYRMVATSVARTSRDSPLVNASAWHRPVITEETKDRLGERQARAAIALLRMGKTEEVIPLLRHSSDPRLRSFIVNWLNPLGADPHVIGTALERIDPGIRPTPLEPPKAMDAILFHPETSQRRALILALGTYGTEGLSPGEREPLIGKLLDLYRNDPDSGIHGSAAWTLRRWGQKDLLRAADAELMKLKDWGDRHWYVNRQGQTYAVIEGPVEFLMGSPPTEPERSGEQTPRPMVIPRRFAIADREVSVEQYQRFVKTNPQFGADPGTLARYSPDAAGPVIDVSWYGAAAYCNWLSEQEGLPKDQWCYAPNPSGAYDEGMTIPADVFKRTGYRLPTEAEWEYACRSGTITSRYYGDSTDLLSRYAWYNANSRSHAWEGGSLLPNELGLFDTLGNAWEWAQDQYTTTNSNIDIVISVHITANIPRLLRGGAFSGQPAVVRSALRFTSQPSIRSDIYGFRPSRTYP